MKNLNLLILIAILVVVNLVSSGYFKRFDLTSEKRFSLSEVSVGTLEGLDRPVYIQVFLEGEFPAQIRQFQDVVRTTLVEMSQYSSDDFDFEFIDPANNAPLREELKKRGITPIPVTVRVSQTETEQKLIYPVALVRHRGRDQYVDLVKGCVFPNGQVNFTKAEANLEYKMISAVRNLNKEKRGVVAILQGHGEHSLELAGDRWNTEMKEVVGELQNAYNIGPFYLENAPGGEISPSIDVLLILQPTQPFSERVKYEIDQYIMRGGNVLWVMDNENVDLDLYQKRATMTSLRDLNLDDMFMNYGFKLNYDLLQDLSCESTEVFQEGPSGGTFVSKPWIYFPMLFDLPVHPVTRNAETVLLRYASTIDTFTREGINHSVFLRSSPYSRTAQGVQFIDLNQILQAPPPKSMFNKQGLITGLMTEGTFSSLFAGRDAPVDSIFPEPPSANFVGRSDAAARLLENLQANDSSLGDRDLETYLKRASSPRRMAVISDGEFVLGKKFRDKRGFLPYDNKAILFNTIDYLAGDETLTEIRAKEVVVRRLDVEKVSGNVSWIRLLNLVLPVLLVALFGVIRFYLRKRKNERLQEKS